MARQRGQTKAEIILSAAQKRMDEALEIRDMYQAQRDKAHEIFEIHCHVYDELKRDLAPKSRSNGTSAKVASKKKLALKTDGNPLSPACGQCGETENHWSHDMSYGTAHPFVPKSSSSARSAKGKSSSASAAKAAGEASTEDAIENALSAVAKGD